MTIHFVYIKGDSISTPCAITNEVAERLKDHYPLKIYDWNEKIIIKPEPGDILIGHPNRDNPRTVYNLSFWQPGWARRIIFSPFAHGQLQYNGYTDEFAVEADIYLAICGRYWFDTNNTALTSHWHYKLLHCDLAVNREHFRAIKSHFGPPGQRRFIYIGSTGSNKGTDYLGRLADAALNVHVGWIGNGSIVSKRVKLHGQQDFTRPEALKLVAGYDFLLTCGRSDANPTTILEATAWGLIPVVTLQSGYYEDNWLVNIPLDDIPGALLVLDRLNNCSESELQARQQAGFRQLDNHYNWDRVAKQVIEAIEMPVPTEPVDKGWQELKAQNQEAIRVIVRRWRRREWSRSLQRLPKRVLKKLLRLVIPSKFE